MRRIVILPLVLLFAIGCGGGVEKGINKDRDKPVPEKIVPAKKPEGKQGEEKQKG